MDRVRATITKNLEEHPEFAEYFKILAVIETHESINPDICIESCRSLIEGVSKTIIIRFDSTKNADNVGDSFTTLFATARVLLSKQCIEIEEEFLKKYGGFISNLNDVRNKRGDISHGRQVPKTLNSSGKLASMVKSTTDSLLNYMLEHYFELDFPTVEKMDYDSKDQEAYNQWLDENGESPVEKVTYSRILFEYDYDAYETRYWDEYIFTLETDEEAESAGTPEETLPEPIGEPETKVLEPVDDPETPPLEPVGSPETRPASLPASKEIPEGDIVPWNDEQEAALAALVDDIKLKLPFARRVVQQYLFDGRMPLAEQIVETLPEKPRLKERRAIVEATTNRLVALAEQLQSAPET